MKTKKQELISIFGKMADMLAIKNESPFKINAYYNAIKSLSNLNEEIESIYEQGKLKNISGIGDGIAKKIEEYLTTGQISKYQELKQEVPESLIELLQIQGLGPKTVALAYQKLGVVNLMCLERVVDNGSFEKLPGIGQKKIENIKHGIKIFHLNKNRILLGLVYPIVTQFKEKLQKIDGVIDVCETGSLRRRKETIGNINFLVAGKDLKKIINQFVNFQEVKNVFVANETEGSIITDDGLKIDLKVVDEESYGSALQYFTGSKAHNIKLREIAKKQGLKINEYGVFKGEKKIAGKTEEEIYHCLGLNWIPPELREDCGEIEENHNLPKLITMEDILGNLHNHTKYSDGSSTLKEMVMTAKISGLKYIAICDHSQTLKYAGGLDPNKLFQQMEEIKKLNKEIDGIRILSGSEVEIKSDGSLDYPDEILEKLDVVIAAIHIGFKHNVTERICKAMENPNVDIIAHPTGRLITSREGYLVDINKILEKAAQTQTILEINAYYDRLDLNDYYCKQAKEIGCKLVINTDSHSKEHLWMIQLGVNVARKGWLEKKDVINTLKADELLDWLNS